MLFGLHVMRGISEVAVEYQLPVLGTNYTADEIYDPDRVCPWSCVSVSRFYALKQDHPGSQAFYDSLYAQYAEWGVDMIKADCLFGDNFLMDQIQGFSDGIDHSGRPMLLSLSPGDGPHDDQVQQATQVSPITNVYPPDGRHVGGLAAVADLQPLGGRSPPRGLSRRRQDRSIRPAQLP